MKKLFLILLTVLFFAACKKEDPIPPLTGTWTLIFTFAGGSSFDGTLTITQNSDNTLSGNFVLSDNSGFMTLLPTSKIDGDAVTIEWMLSTYLLSYQGSANSARTSMSGSFYSSGVNMGTWLANKKL